MLLNLVEYHCPEDLQTALTLLNRSEMRTVALAGGTALIGSSDPAVQAVVDLRKLGLGGIEQAADGLRLGATLTLQQLVRSEQVKGELGGALCDAARRSANRQLRSMATVGGLVAAADPLDDLLLGFVALGAQAVLAPGDERIGVEQVLTNNREALRHRLITSVLVPSRPGHARLAFARVGRTPLDKPIVNVAAYVVAENGQPVQATLAIGGAGPHVFTARWNPGFGIALGRLPDIVGEVLTQLDLPGDYRGSAGYRRHMAMVLTQRALGEAGVRNT